MARGFRVGVLILFDIFVVVVSSQMACDFSFGVLPKRMAGVIVVILLDIIVFVVSSVFFFALSRLILWSSVLG